MVPGPLFVFLIAENRILMNYMMITSESDIFYGLIASPP